MFTPEEQGTKVLIVDDVVSARRVVRRLLEKIGFNDIEEAPNGKVALERLQHGGIGIVISDWNMPDMSGVELAKKVRAEELTSKLPFLMITSQSSREEVVEAIKSGVNDYVVKPFSFDTLASKLRRAIDHAGE